MYRLVVANGPYEGQRVNEEGGGVPWSGSRLDAEKLRGEMIEQARRFGHHGTDYRIEPVEEEAGT